MSRNEELLIHEALTTREESMSSKSEKNSHYSPVSHASQLSPDMPSAKTLFHNFILFSLFYSMAHATVDSVLAFSSAELGTDIGSKSGFTLYLVYAVSCLFIAKPALRLLEAKRSVTIGLVSLLIFVGSFYIAVLVPSIALFIFVLGSAISGIGSGILWTAQSSYYAINSKQYSLCSQTDQGHAINNFAAIFAVLYLSCETGFKLLATLVFFVEEKSGDNTSWRFIVFSFYTVAAAVSVVLFTFLTLPLVDNDDDFEQSSRSRTASITSRQSGRSQQSSHSQPRFEFRDTTVSAIHQGSAYDSNDAIEHASGESSLVRCSLNHFRHGKDLTKDRSMENPVTNRTDSTMSVASMSIGSRRSDSDGRDHKTLNLRQIAWAPVLSDVGAVCTTVWHVRKLQLLIPFQLTFGLSIVFMGNYITGTVVEENIGDGWIGLLSSLTTLSAIILAGPCAYISNHHAHGKWMIMVAGSLCFLFEALSVITLPEHTVASWGFIVPLYLIHGAGRGVFENTNKAVISEYFPDPQVRSAAFATVYFSSGFAAAVGFLLYQYITRNQFIALFMSMSILAIICYCMSHQIHLDTNAVNAVSAGGEKGGEDSPSTDDGTADHSFNTCDDNDGDKETELFDVIIARV
jgi:hypothetical protein